MRAIVTGMIATYPVGGVAWDYGQYALGLEQLGIDVYYLEDTGLPSYTWNETTGQFDEDCSYGVQFLERALAALSPTLGQRWHFRAYDGSVHGIDARTFSEIVAGADVFINVSGGSVLREDYLRCPRKILIDTDPGWNHFVTYANWDKKPPSQQRMGFRSHDYFFTYALRLGQPGCPLDSFGLKWKSTRPPVVLDCWQAEPPADKWTTVMMWKNYGEPILHDGVAYGAKEMEFDRVERLPSRSPSAFEVAINGGGPVERWTELGWSVVNGHAKSHTPEVYRSYVQGSRGEFSVAKNIYVATRSGWFSCRTVCYLAAGRPAVVQETGFSEMIPVGEGLLSFRNLEEAAEAISIIEADYTGHAEAARDLAVREFASGKVLTDLLSDVGLE